MKIHHIPDEHGNIIDAVEIEDGDTSPSTWSHGIDFHLSQAQINDIQARLLENRKSAKALQETLSFNAFIASLNEIVRQYLHLKSQFAWNGSESDLVFKIKDWQLILQKYQAVLSSLQKSDPIASLLNQAEWCEQLNPDSGLNSPPRTIFEMSQDVSQLADKLKLILPILQSHIKRGRPQTDPLRHWLIKNVAHAYEANLGIKPTFSREGPFALLVSHLLEAMQEPIDDVLPIIKKALKQNQG